MTDYPSVLTKLHQNFNLLGEREAKYGGNAPLELLYQITGHERAICLTQQAQTGELTEAGWREEMAPLLVEINRHTSDTAAGVTLGNFSGGIHGSIIAERDAKGVTTVDEPVVVGSVM